MNHLELRNAVKGSVLLPGEDGFDAASRPWSVAVPQPVAAVVELADDADAVGLVRYAKDNGTPITVQPSGHGASGNTADAILVRTGRLDSVEVDPDRRSARAGAGVKWGAVLAEAGKHGLTGLAGSSPLVSVVGYTLGGGLSWFGRKYGVAAESVTALDVVLASGETARVTAESESELFWALRGGGGDFAVVTAMEFGLHPTPVLYGGRMMWPDHRTRAVFEAFADITATAPDELTMGVGRLKPPGAPAMVGVDLAFLGPADDARDLLGPLELIGDAIADTRGPVAVADLGEISDDPVDPSAVKARADLLSELDLDRLLAEPIDPLLAVQVRHLGGALALPGSGPTGGIDEPYVLNQLGLLPDPQSAAAVGDKQARIIEGLGTAVTGRKKPYTALGPGDSAADVFTEPVLERLRRVKRTYDPDGIIRANHPVHEARP